jgi:hypothetical protein
MIAAPEGPDRALTCSPNLEAAERSIRLAAVRTVHPLWEETLANLKRQAEE